MKLFAVNTWRFGHFRAVRRLTKPEALRYGLGVKPKHFLLPLAALMVSAVVLGLQERGIFKLEAEAVLLEQATAKQTQSIAEASALELEKKSKEAAKNTGPLDWRKIAEQILGWRKGDRDMKAMMSFRERLQAMTRDELIVALDEIAALGLPEETRDMLELEIAAHLGGKDPEYVLMRFADRIQEGNDSFGYWLGRFFGDWAAKDPSKAVAWFDAQIAAGKFASKTLDGESRNKSRFEAALLKKLLGADFETISARFATMTKRERESVFSYAVLSELDAAGQVNLAKLIRTQIPEADRNEILGSRASDFFSSEEGYTKITEFLDRIQATADERTAAAESAASRQLSNIRYARKATREDLDSMRAWVSAQSPQSVNKTTGEALNEILDGDFAWSFTDAAKLAVEYNQASESDEVLKTFLGGYYARKHKEEARALAEKIKDVNVRNSILENLN